MPLECDDNMLIVLHDPPLKTYDQIKFKLDLSILRLFLKKWKTCPNWVQGVIWAIPKENLFSSGRSFRTGLSQTSRVCARNLIKCKSNGAKQRSHKRSCYLHSHHYHHRCHLQCHHHQRPGTTSRRPGHATDPSSVVAEGSNNYSAVLMKMSRE